MNAGIPSRLIARPFTQPITAPSSSVSTNATITFTPLANVSANTIPVSPATDPTERSIPAVMMVNSSP